MNNVHGINRIDQGTEGTCLDFDSRALSIALIEYSNVMGEVTGPDESERPDSDGIITRNSDDQAPLRPAVLEQGNRAAADLYELVDMLLPGNSVRLATLDCYILIEAR
jgi:hypothetical protein